MVVLVELGLLAVMDLRVVLEELQLLLLSLLQEVVEVRLVITQVEQLLQVVLEVLEEAPLLMVVI
jgi:hypothetical protein